MEQAAGDVQQPVAQRPWLGAGQCRVVGQENGLGPADEVDGEHDRGQPRGVDRGCAGGEAAQAGVLAGADTVLDGVGPVAGVEERELPDAGVGGQALVAGAFAFFEGVELGAGVGPFAADEDASSRRRPP